MIYLNFRYNVLFFHFFYNNKYIMTDIQFILFGDVMAGNSVWCNNNQIDFINKL